MQYKPRIVEGLYAHEREHGDRPLAFVSHIYLIYTFESCANMHLIIEL